MCGNVIFVAGVYGVGKSTLCNMLSEALNIPTFSSGDLISEKNGEKYGVNKYVNNKENNQNLLINAVKDKITESSTILLAGHFCIFNSDNEIDYLPEFVYKELHLTKIILLEADASVIVGNLQSRDRKNYAIENLNKLLVAEKRQAIKIAKELNIPLILHKMNYNESDFDRVISVIKGSDI